MKLDTKTIREFAILSFDANSIKGCRFRRKKTIFYPDAYTTIELKSGEDPIPAWKKVFRMLGRGRECPLYVTGILDNSFFFRFNSIELKPKMRREALNLEISQHLPIVPDDCQFQFFSDEKDGLGEVPINLYAIPRTSLETLMATISQVGAKADEFIYPLLALEADDTAIDLARIDENFGFEDGQWRPIKQDMDFSKWEENFSNIFEIPSDTSFKVKDYFECLLVGRLILSSTFKAQTSALSLLPKNVHPRRLRRQITVAILLIILLLINFVWSGFGRWNENYKSYKSSTAMKARLTNENSLLTRKNRANEKAQKELAKIVAISAGERNVIAKLADLSSKLPSDVLVSTFRWSESSLDLVLQTSSTNLNVPEIIKQMPYWKIGQLQQRRATTSATTIILKLQPAGDDKK